MVEAVGQAVGQGAISMKGVRGFSRGFRRAACVEDREATDEDNLDIDGQVACDGEDDDFTIIMPEGLDSRRTSRPMKATIKATAARASGPTQASQVPMSGLTPATMDDDDDFNHCAQHRVSNLHALAASLDNERLSPPRVDLKHDDDDILE